MPASVSEPPPALVNPPEPVIAWETVVLKPLVSNVPPPAFRAMARVLARLKLCAEP